VGDTVERMIAAEPCTYCGVLDALDRHRGDCQYAIDIGLPRLADGEEPIAPSSEAGHAMADAEEEEGEAPARPERTIQAPGASRARRQSTELWMSYSVDGSENFDAVVFGSEIEALRHAVDHGNQVIALELGKPLRAQACV
jgi:hypothetical protein